MAGSKRERELHREKIARQQKEAAAAAERRKRSLQITGAVVGVLVVIGAVVGVALASKDSNDSPSASGTPAATSTPSVVTVSCTEPNSKQPGTTQYKSSDFTGLKLNPEGVYSETLTTNCGKIAFDLDSKGAPQMSKAMLFLTDRTTFYENTSCHRLTTEGIYVLQCGDPRGDGSGGPGFKLAEENLPKADGSGSAVYKRGTVAMANAGPGTTGSQFFLVYKDSPLPPNYTVIGTITEGLDVLDGVAAKGTANGTADGAPKQPVQIQKMVSALTTTVEPPS